MKKTLKLYLAKDFGPNRDIEAIYKDPSVEEYRETVENFIGLIYCYLPEKSVDDLIDGLTDVRARGRFNINQPEYFNRILKEDNDDGIDS